MHHRIFIFALVAMWIVTGVRAADPGPNDQLDRLLAEALKDLNNRGADLNNAGDTLGCYRMYQGGLLALKPLLAHRPTAQKQMDEALRSAETRPPLERARVLHLAIAATHAQLKPQPTPLHQPKPLASSTPPAAPKPEGAPIVAPPVSSTPSNDPPVSFPPAAAGTSPPPVPAASFPSPSPAPPLTPPPATSLWARLGDRDKVEKLVDDWVTRSLADTKVNLSRGGKYKLEGEGLATMKRRLVGYVSLVSDGTYPITFALKDVHECMSFTTDEFDALVGQLKAAGTAQGVAIADIQALADKVNESKRDVVSGSK